jgi:acyl-homoserine lactone acylase PvdQ
VGQSGNLLSPHYDNLTKMWGTGEYLEMTLRTTSAQLKGDPPQYKRQLCEPDIMQ